MSHRIALLNSVRSVTSFLLTFLSHLIKYVITTRFNSPSDSLQDQDGALKSDELDEIFSTSPGNPWAAQKFSDTTLSDDTGAITLQGWLAQWRCVPHRPSFSHSIHRK